MELNFLNDVFMELLFHIKKTTIKMAMAVRNIVNPICKYFFSNLIFMSYIIALNQY